MTVEWATALLPHLQRQSSASAPFSIPRNRPPCKISGGSKTSPGKDRERASSRPPPARDRHADFALLHVHAGDRARDHQLLDLGGSLEDVVDQSVMALQSRSGLPMRNRPRRNPVESGRIRTRLARDWRAVSGRYVLAPTRSHAGTPDAVIAPQRIIRPVAQLGSQAPTQAAGRAPAPATPTQGSTDRGPSA
jgi:hypothetical protein